MRIVNAIDGVSRWSGFIVAPLVLVYLVVLLYEMVARYLFNSPTDWAHEVGTYIFGVQFMLGGAYCLWSGGMVNVEIVPSRFSHRTRALIDVILYVTIFAVLAAMIWYGGKSFLYSLRILERSGSEFAPPLYPLRGIIPLAAFLMLLQATAKLIRDFFIVFEREHSD